MGFSGTVLLVQMEVDYEEIGDELDLPGVAVDGWQAGPWAFAVFDDIDVLGDEADLEAVAEQTGSGCLAAWVVDSDYAHLFGYAPTSGAWRAVIGREAVAGYLEDEGSSESVDDQFPPPQDEAAAIATWAQEVGLSVDAQQLTDLLTTEPELFADEPLSQLVAMLVSHLEVPPTSVASSS